MYLFDLYPFFSLWRVLILMGLQEKLSKNSLKAVEDDLELLYKEDQLKMNSLDIMIPLHLNQVKKKKNFAPNVCQTQPICYTQMCSG